MKEFENSIDLIITSPPYLNLRKYDTEEIIQLGHEENKDEYCKNVANIFSQLYPTLKKTANVFINIGESFSEGVGLGIPQLLKHYIETETKLIYKDQLIWSKSNPKPQNETIKRPINNIEYILWFVVDPKIAKYNLLTYTKPGKKATKCSGVKDVSSNGEVQKRIKSISKPYSKIYSHLKEQDIANIIELKTCKNFDVYNISSKGHPAIMSPLLPVIPILMCSDENTVENKSIIYDPFSGSNVVSRIGQLLNRTTISTELSDKYFSIGCKMIENSINDFNREELDIINQIAYGEENLVSIAA
jgi:DNA modification methylase